MTTYHASVVAGALTCESCGCLVEQTETARRVHAAWHDAFAAIDIDLTELAAEKVAQ